MNNPPKRPGATRPPPPTVTSTQRPPVNVKDALTEARAIAGGALGRPSSAPGSLSPQAARGRKTVLLVDPDASMRARLACALEAHYDVIEAKDGMEAVEMAATIQPPAMIVTENVMPRVDGFTLAKVLRQNPVMKKVPIMFVSVAEQPAGRDAGARRRRVPVRPEDHAGQRHRREDPQDRGVASLVEVRLGSIPIRVRGLFLFMAVVLGVRLRARRSSRSGSRSSSSRCSSTSSATRSSDATSVSSRRSSCMAWAERPRGSILASVGHARGIAISLAGPFAGFALAALLFGGRAARVPAAAPARALRARAGPADQRDLGHLQSRAACCRSTAAT